MLTVQVNYQGVQETIRHNKVAEQQNERSLEQNAERLLQGWVSIEETHRHNVATEQLAGATLAETTRHNMATESLGYANLAYNYESLGEIKRHNVATEGVQWAQVDLAHLNYEESARHNKALESEQTRHDMENESIARKQNDINEQRFITQAAQGFQSLALQQEANEINRQKNEIAAEANEIEREKNRRKSISDYWHNVNESFRELSDMFALDN